MLSETLPPSEVRELSARLRLSVTRLARQLRQTSDADLTPTQLSVLATVGNHGPLTLGQLAERELVASPTITRVANALHERGLILRIPDPADRRFVRVELSPEGRSLLDEIRNRRNVRLTERLRTLSPDELATLTAAASILDELARGDLGA